MVTLTSMMQKKAIFVSLPSVNTRSIWNLIDVQYHEQIEAEKILYFLSHSF